MRSDSHGTASSLAVQCKAIVHPPALAVHSHRALTCMVRPFLMNRIQAAPGGAQAESTPLPGVVGAACHKPCWPHLRAAHCLVVLLLKRGGCPIAGPHWGGHISFSCLQCGGISG